MYVGWGSCPSLTSYTFHIYVTSNSDVTETFRMCDRKTERQEDRKTGAQCIIRHPHRLKLQGETYAARMRIKLRKVYSTSFDKIRLQTGLCKVLGAGCWVQGIAVRTDVEADVVKPLCCGKHLRTPTSGAEVDKRVL